MPDQIVTCWKCLGSHRISERKSAIDSGVRLPLSCCPRCECKFTFPIVPAKHEDDDICGLCGEPGADKLPHPVYWPGERVPNTDLVHAECEQEECSRAHAALTDRERQAFLSSI